jgi:hypothetical protein
MIKTNHLRSPLVQFIGDTLFISNELNETKLTCR